jgi:hypothetical protein
VKCASQRERREHRPLAAVEEAQHAVRRDRHARDSVAARGSVTRSDFEGPTAALTGV